MKPDPSRPKLLIRFNNSTLVHDIALLRLDRPAKRKQVTIMIIGTTSVPFDFMLLPCTYPVYMKQARVTHYGAIFLPLSSVPPHLG